MDKMIVAGLNHDNWLTDESAQRLASQFGCSVTRVRSRLTVLRGTGFAPPASPVRTRKPEPKKTKRHKEPPPPSMYDGHWDPSLDVLLVTSMLGAESDDFVNGLANQVGVPASVVRNRIRKLKAEQ